MLTRFQSILAMLRADPLGAVIYIVFFVVGILLSLIMHECAHGYIAYRCGDPTAKMFGRLSLDPRKHLDPVGTIFMVLFGFGWARPVPVNPRNYRHARRDDILVSVAGIVTNFILFLVSLGLSVLVLYLMVGSDFMLRVRYTNGTISLLNMADPSTRESIYWTFVNYQLQGLSSSELTSFMAIPWLQYVYQFLTLMCSFNISLAIFNLIPIPPLDGYHLLNDTVFRGRLILPGNADQILRLLLLALCWFGALNGFLSTCINGAWGFFLRMFLSFIPA